jgi:protein subunit release factor B
LFVNDEQTEGGDALPIIRVTKEQIEKANKAREAALLKNPEHRLYEERQQLRRQAASEKKAQIKDTNKSRQAAPPNDPNYRPCDERQRLDRESVAREMERES